MKSFDLRSHEQATNCKLCVKLNQHFKHAACMSKKIDGDLTCIKLWPQNNKKKKISHAHSRAFFIYKQRKFTNMVVHVYLAYRK